MNQINDVYVDKGEKRQNKNKQNAKMWRPKNTLKSLLIPLHFKTLPSTFVSASKSLFKKTQAF